MTNHVHGGSIRFKATIYVWEWVTTTEIQTPNWIWTSDSSVWKTLECNTLRALFYSIGYDVLNYLVGEYTIISALGVGQSRLYREPNVLLPLTTAVRKSVLIS